MIDQTTKDILNQHIVQTLWKREGVDINPYKEGYNSALTEVQNLIESLPCEEKGTWTGSSRDKSEKTNLQNDIDTIRDYEVLKERFKPYLIHCYSPVITGVTWDESFKDKEFEVYYEETFCGCTDTCSLSFPANIFDMTPEEYNEIVEKQKAEEKRLRELEREKNERELLAKLKKKYESEEVKDIFRKAEGILLNEEDK